jgi:3-dehydroquinate synthase
VSIYIFLGVPKLYLKDLFVLTRESRNGKVKFVLLDGIGSFIINQEVENELIRASFEDYKI